MNDLRFTPYTSNLAEKSIESVRTSAEQLAKLLQHTSEFQELLRLGRLVNLDPDVQRLITQINHQESVYNTDGNNPSIEELQAQLEGLPAYQTYMHAENAARDLFQSVNQAISAAAGLDFAINARRSGCSCGS